VDRLLEVAERRPRRQQCHRRGGDADRCAVTEDEAGEDQRRPVPQ
jgi:hypothetical protein